MDYFIPQRDSRPERAQELAEARSTYNYNEKFGFPVTASKIDDNTGGNSYQLKALAGLEKVRMDLLAMRHKGRWNFTNESPPVAPLKLARLIHQQQTIRRWHRQCDDAVLPPLPRRRLGDLARD